MWSKSFLSSKTFWANAVALVLTLVTSFANAEFSWVPPEVITFLAGTIIPTLNWLLRFLTNQPVHVAGPPKLHIAPEAVSAMVSSSHVVKHHEQARKVA